MGGTHSPGARTHGVDIGNAITYQSVTPWGVHNGMSAPWGGHINIQPMGLTDSEFMASTPWVTRVCPPHRSAIGMFNYVIIIILAYFYCTAYTKIRVNESSLPCDQRCITFSSAICNVK